MKIKPIYIVGILNDIISRYLVPRLWTDDYDGGRLGPCPACSAITARGWEKKREFDSNAVLSDILRKHDIQKATIEACRYNGMLFKMLSDATNARLKTENE